MLQYHHQRWVDADVSSGHVFSAAEISCSHADVVYTTQHNTNSVTELQQCSALTVKSLFTASHLIICHITHS